MENKYIIEVGNGFSPNPNEDVCASLFKQYERVLFESLITSFGLDCIIRDQHGGDVDTIHSVRQIGKDSKMSYKSDAHRQAYDNHGDYDSYAYHTHTAYRDRNREVSEQKKQGCLLMHIPGKKYPATAKLIWIM